MRCMTPTIVSRSARRGFSSGFREKEGMPNFTYDSPILRAGCVDHGARAARGAGRRFVESNRPAGKS
jgi:hypothetical protein